MTQLRFGKRLLKTAVAVFVTAQICYLLNWPMIFAVIAAIVSIEPTVSASIHKGKVRLPSAAIGAAFAMIFDYLLGPQPVTFALSALATIYVCQLLRWNDTIVVATLTAVNMIPLTEAHFLINFLIRLGTTMTGILVSVLVNYFIFRPDYAAELRGSLTAACERMLAAARHEPEMRIDRGETGFMKTSFDRIQSLLDYQISDYRFKKASFADLRELAEARQCLRLLRRILFYTEAAAGSKSADERILCRELRAAALRQLAASPFACTGSRITVRTVDGRGLDA
ncbi:aromatic acid exporter family protein [Paenibacillus tarimensis]